MKKVVIASLMIALCAGTAIAQEPAKKKSTKPVSVKKVPPATKRQAIEEATPLSEPAITASGCNMRNPFAAALASPR